MNNFHFPESLSLQEIKRAEKLLQKAIQLQADSDRIRIFLSPGRIEMIGNHTDHQKGKTLSAAINQNMMALAWPNQSNEILVYSQGFEPFSISLEDLVKNEAEKESSKALVKGLLAAFLQDYPDARVQGLTIVMDSQVAAGSGLSSSAAFEMLIAAIFHSFFQGDFDPVQMAKEGQFAENEYFGKPSGLLDQLSCATGSLVYIDHGKEPLQVEKVQAPAFFKDYAILLANTNSNHADLSDAYGEIVEELKKISDYYGLDQVSKLSEKQLVKDFEKLRESAGDRALLRALHVLQENNRVKQALKALEEEDEALFLQMLNDSGHSSFEYLQNVSTFTGEQAMPLALAVASLFPGVLAKRVHGGGFGGSILVLVKKEDKEDFIDFYQQAFGKNSVLEVEIAEKGAYQA